MKHILHLMISFLCLYTLTGNHTLAQERMTKEERMQWWSEARFGMFIHFGVYAQWGGVYHGHQQARGGAEWILNRAKIPVQEYVDSAKNFNPVHYNPEEWVIMAKNAGMKYIIITAKHHDGFTLFDTEASAWNVVDAAKYGKDMLKPLAEACRKHDMKLGFYYSQAQDWVNPGGSAARRFVREGWPNPDSSAVDAYTLAHGGHWDPIQETESFQEYIDKIAVPQVRELLSNYGDIAVLWWDTPVDMTDEAAQKLDALLALQPHIITNDRLKRPNFPGDTKTPEQKIPSLAELDGTYWETCMTMNGSWGYKSWDDNWKSTDALITNLVDAASKGGNYLLNIGPKPDGTFPQESMTRLTQIGNWMNVNHEAIYNTQRSPIGQSDAWRCTMKKEGNNSILYLSITNSPADGVIRLPKLPNKILSANVLVDNKRVTIAEQGEELVFALPATYKSNRIPVVKILVEGTVKEQTVLHPSKKMDSGALDEKPL